MFMKTLLFFLNRSVMVLNVLLAGLMLIQSFNLKKLEQKKIPLWLHICLLFTLGFIAFCCFYAPYLRDQALNSH